MDNLQNSSTSFGATTSASIAPSSSHAPLLLSRELFRDSNTVQIEHEGQRYLLRLTRGNKLILTK